MMQGNDFSQLHARISDLKSVALKRRQTQFSRFLTPVERAYVQNNRELNKDVKIFFKGGYDEAERTLAVILPLSAYDNEEFYDIPLSTLSVNYKGDKLSHRDILGALMGLGIKREMIGDILDCSEPPILVCNSTIAEYIIQNFTKAGRANVECKHSQITEVTTGNFEEITATVASLRLDSVLAEGFGLSRSKAQEAIQSGIVYVNWVTCESSSKEIKQGDSITLRSMGKIVLNEISGLSRKNRTFIKIRKFVK